MEGGPSRTAIGAAVARGLHRIVDDAPSVLDDPFALPFVGPSWQKVAQATRDRYPEQVVRQMRGNIVARSRYAEDQLVGGAYSQYVILGAGLDSFAWRRPRELAGLSIFEVDHPASSEWKAQRIDQAGLASQPRHHLVAADLEVEDLEHCLTGAGCDRSLPTLFSWLGVVPYLTVAAIESTLRTIAKWSSESRVVMEYSVSDEHVDDVARAFRRTFTPLARGAGEPVLTALAPTDAEDLITRCGLRVSDHPDRMQLVAMYFANRVDGLRPWNASRFMVATTL